MPRPSGFSWIDKPRLAAMARPDSPEELAWLRQQGVELLISLTEQPLRRDWVNDAGLLVLNVPIEDMEPPTPTQLEHVISAVTKAHSRGMGVGIHCTAGLGRTGAVLAGYFVSQGRSARDAIAHVRELRPGSIETTEQAEAIEAFARNRGRKSG